MAAHTFGGNGSGDFVLIFQSKANRYAQHRHRIERVNERAGDENLIRTGRRDDLEQSMVAKRQKAKAPKY